MAQVRLPKYVTPKRLASGKVAYYWNLPTWAKKPALRHGLYCPLISTALGQNLAEAIKLAEGMNEAFSEWRNGAVSKTREGSITWLFQWYQQQERFLKNKAKTRTDYRYSMEKVAAWPMKNGVLGDRLASAVTASVADHLYREMRKNGERQAALAMQICRLVWTWAVRHHDVTGCTFNPFSKMGIKATSTRENRPTTRAEYDLYRETARNLGYQSMATAAALSFELCQRVWDVFGFVDSDGRKARGFVWPDYVEGSSIKVVQSKTGKLVALDLTDVIDGKVTDLYPELEAELERMPRLAVQIVVTESTGQPYKQRAMSKIHRQICDAAGLPSEMTFTGFRHGGITELGDAGEDDVRPISGHTELKTTAIYNKMSRQKALRIARKRREHIAICQNGPENVSEWKGAESLENG